MFNRISTAINNFRINRQYKRILHAIQNGYTLISATQWKQFETKRYYYQELGIDFFNYQLVDSDNNHMEFVPGYIVDMLPEDQFRKIQDTCKLGEFYRIEIVYPEYDNLTITEAQRTVQQFESMTGIMQARMVKEYPNLLSDYVDEFTPTLAYDKDCKPTKKQGKEIFNNNLVQSLRNERTNYQTKYYSRN